MLWIPLAVPHGKSSNLMITMLAGILLVALVLYDVFQSIIVPRASPMGFRIAPFPHEVSAMADRPKVGTYFTASKS